MSCHTEVRDYVIWSRHLHGDRDLSELIDRLAAGEVISLTVDGVRGEWVKMAHGKDGRPTPGIRPLGSAQTFWRELYKSRRGAVVEIAAAEDNVGARRAALFDALAKSDADRSAALQALFEMSGQGWRSEGRTVDRDELHTR